jgi:hypothetical protein
MLATSSFAAEAGTTEHEGVSLKPQMLVQLGGFGIHKLDAGDLASRCRHHRFFTIATRRVKAIPERDSKFLGVVG